jgi:hypothetical protein
MPDFLVFIIDSETVLNLLNIILNNFQLLFVYKDSHFHWQIKTVSIIYFPATSIKTDYYKTV